jgi:hypothetical protein
VPGMAKRLKVSTTHLYDVMAGRRNPSLALAVRAQDETQGRVTPNDWTRARTRKVKPEDFQA